MSKLSNFIKQNNIDSKKITYKNKAIIIELEKEKIVLKKDNKNIKDIYEYLSSRSFPYILYPEKITDNYSIYKYINEVNTIKEEKAIHLMNILTDLQNRTTTYKEYTLDEIKEIYENNLSKINTLFQYYNDLEESFSLHVYPSPYELLYLNNVSKIYNVLEYSRTINEKWYKIVNKNKKKRIVFLHNHLSLDHFIDDGVGKLINFNFAKYGIVIDDFKNFYKVHFRELDMESLFDAYQKKYKFSDSELLLLFLELMIPEKIKLTNNIMTNTLIISNLINYIDITRKFVLKEQEKNKKENNKEFNK